MFSCRRPRRSPSRSGYARTWCDCWSRVGRTSKYGTCSILRSSECRCPTGADAAPTHVRTRTCSLTIAGSERSSVIALRVMPCHTRFHTADAETSIQSQTRAPPESNGSRAFQYSIQSMLSAVSGVHRKLIRYSMCVCGESQREFTDFGGIFVSSVLRTNIRSPSFFRGLPSTYT